MPIKSDYPDIQIDERPFSTQFMERLTVHANEPNKIAIINADYSNERLTYRNLRLYIAALSDFLYGCQFNKGDVACIVSPNCSQYAIIFGAIATCGGILSGVNDLFVLDEIRAQIIDSGASALFCHESVLEKVRNVRDRYKKIKFLVIITDANKELSTGENEYLLNNLFKRNTTAKDRKSSIVKKDALLLPYSSGISGLAKGVLISHYNLSCVSASYDYVMNTSVWPRGCKNYQPTRESLILIHPFYHVYGLVILLQSLMDGSRVILMKKIQGELFCSLIQKYKPKMQMLMPSLLNFLATSPIVSKFDLSSITLFVSTAAPLRNDLASAIKFRFSNVRYVAQMYGMTELTSISHYPHLIDAKFKQGAVGKLGPNLELKIVCPETGEELRLDKLGEICIRGPIVMTGYLNNDEATKSIIDSKGFLHTGDLGYVDSRHRVVHIVDRLKELIKVSGRQVAPAELENILMSHPSIADCAVMGVTRDKCVEVPKAFVVLKPDKTPSSELVNELIKYVRERVSPYKQLSGGVQFCLSIPRSSAGKILRSSLKDQVNK